MSVGGDVGGGELGGRTPFAAPLYVAQGDDDDLVVPTDTDGFVAHERGIGIDVTYRKVPDATHATIAYLALRV